MKEKTDFKNKPENFQPPDDNDIIDLTEKNQELIKLEINHSNLSRENIGEDIIELCEEAQPPQDDEKVIELTEEISIPSEKDSTSSDTFPQKTSVSDHIIEAAIERAIRRILVEKFELIFMEAVQKIIREDIKKLKEQILREHEHKT